MSKAFGLIVPTGKAPIKPKPTANFSRPSIFGDDSDSDEDTPKAISKGPGINQKLHAKKIQAKALEEDPTIFQYDELYDEMEQQRNEIKKAKSSEVKKPKYIGKLLETAEKRKKEQERRIERQVQKEREAEGEMYKDKESFVTSAYRAKLEEMRLAEEEEKREAYLESIGDVTKQKDLGGFYRHLYEQRMGGPEESENKSSDEKPEPPKSIKVVEKAKERSYRKRKSSQDEKEEAEEESRRAEEAKKAHLQSNLDADSDFSIDSSSDEEDVENKENPPLEVNPDATPGVTTEPKPKLESVPSNSDHKVDNLDEDDKSSGDEHDENKSKKETEKKPPAEPKPKIDIWKKRTVGEAFESALARYYERKVLRESQRSY